MAYPLPAGTLHTVPTAMMVAPQGQVTELTTPTRTPYKLTWTHSRTGLIATITAPHGLVTELGSVTRTWAPTVILNYFPSEITYGQWWSRASRDRP